MCSAAREQLPRRITNQGIDGRLLAPRADREPGMSQDGLDLPPGTIRFPDCLCARHRAGRGRPDSSVRLRAGGRA